MRENSPDCWVILKVVSEKETLYKVLAGWGGSYLYGSSWKLNSGITKIEQDEEFYYFHGYSGSIYKCHKDLEEVRMAIAPELEKFTSINGVSLITSKELLKEFNELG